jgi:hypothetical protein
VPKVHRLSALLSMLIVIEGSAAAQPTIVLNDLTVPREHLPADCVLAPDVTSIGLRVKGNPWIGVDRHLVATIRERVSPLPPVPDGPPLTPRGSARFRLRLVEDIEEAYAAAYGQDAPDRVVVYGLRFTSATGSDELFRDRRIRDNPRVMRVAVGRILAVVHGDGGTCAQAIGTYLKSLGK